MGIQNKDLVKNYGSANTGNGTEYYEAPVGPPCLPPVLQGPHENIRSFYIRRKAAERAEAVREVVEDLICPSDLSRKYNVSVHTIRVWVGKAGLRIPKNVLAREREKLSKAYKNRFPTP